MKGGGGGQEKERHEPGRTTRKNFIQRVVLAIFHVMRSEVLNYPRIRGNEHEIWRNLATVNIEVVLICQPCEIQGSERRNRRDVHGNCGNLFSVDCESWARDGPHIETEKCGKRP